MHHTNQSSEIMKKALFLLIFTIHCSLFTVHCFSQDPHLIDSLETQLKKHNATKLALGKNSPMMNDTLMAKVLIALSQAYWGYNPEKAMDYARKALALSEQIGLKKGMANAYNSMGVIYDQKGDYYTALEFHKKALKIREEIGFKKGIAGSYNNIGHIYWRQGNYSETLKNYFASLKIREEIGDKKGISSSYNNIGNIYYIQGNYPEALKNYIASLKISEETGDKEGIANSYNNNGVIYEKQGNYPEALKNYFAALKISEEIGYKQSSANTYSNIGNIYSMQANYPEALKNYFASLKIFEEIGDKNGIANSYNNIGVIYERQGNYPEALKNYFVGLKASEEIGDKEGIANSYNNLGTIYTNQKKYNEASGYLNKALSLSKEIGLLEINKSSYKSLTILDSAQGNFKLALEHYKMFVTTRDSMFNKENTKKLVQSKMQYEFDKKEALTKVEQEKKDAVAHQELQTQKIVRNGFMCGFAIVLLFAGVLFTQRNKIRKGKKRSDELLLNILPSEVAEELKAKGSADAKQFDEVTVMFTDFKGFTQISEKLSPAELVAEIHTCFKAFDNIITRYNIEKIKTIGDSYMCAGGLPVTNKTNAIDVVNAALEIRQFIKEHLQQRNEEGKESFEIRIGVHTGPVVAGIVGVKKFAYDIWGDTVNIASRMESSGEAGQVNISGTTHSLVKDKFTCTHRGKIAAKNKGEIDMYFVEA